MSQAEMNSLPGPSFWRRVACNLYEQLVLLGVVALTFLLPNLALGMILQISLPSWLTFFYLYGVLGLYFVWYWTRTGQTLAMQTWRIQLLSNTFPATGHLALHIWLIMVITLHHFAGHFPLSTMANYWITIYRGTPFFTTQYFSWSTP